MNSKQRVRAVMAGEACAHPVVSLYVSWPEYGWRFSGHPCWELILGDVDALPVHDRLFQRHPSDFAAGPVDRMGNRWALDKIIECETPEGVHFRCPKTGRRWLFRQDSHVLTEIHAETETIRTVEEAGGSVPRTVAEAEDWFRRRYGGASAAPAHDPACDRAIQRWGRDLFMVTCTLSPFVAVVYALGYEPALTLLAESPRVFARLEELHLEYYAAHYEWAALAGYDGGHMVDSYTGADTISPATYRDWVAPIHRQCAAMIHRCGLLADLYLPGYMMPMLTDLRGQGWDAIRLEDRCKGIEQDIGEIRRVLGSDQCLFGNMDAYALLRGDWSEIAARARYQWEVAGRTGPFIISNGSGLCDATEPAIVDRWLDYARALAS